MSCGARRLPNSLRYERKVLYGKAITPQAVTFCARGFLLCSFLFLLFVAAECFATDQHVADTQLVLEMFNKLLRCKAEWRGRRSK